MFSFKKYFIVVLVLFCSSCEKSKTQALQAENVEKQNRIEEQQKQISRLEERLSALEETNKNSMPSSENNYNSGIQSSQFYFIVLEVVENHISEKRQMYYTTQVNQISSYNDNIKYQLLDEVVSNYKNSPSGRVYEGSVKSRNIYLFNNYEDASKAREKYIMN